MSDNEKSTVAGGKAGGGWTDKERLVYLFALIETTNVKLDYKNTPRPNGRSEIACQRMMERLKTTIKDELEALKSGSPIANVTPKKRGPNKAKGSDGAENEDGTPKSTPKRKSKANGDADGSPKKRGRKPKIEADVEAEIKAEVIDEDGSDNEI